MRVAALVSIFESHLIADFAAEVHSHFLRHARSQQSCRETAWLENDNLAVPEQSVLQQHLRNLCGFAGTGRRLKDETPGIT